MEKKDRNWLKGFLIGVAILILHPLCVFLYFVYQVNQTNHLAIQKRVVDEIYQEEKIAEVQEDKSLLENGGNQKDIKVEDFILTVLVRGIPKIARNQERCYEGIEKELTARNLSYSLIDDDLQGGDDIAKVISFYRKIFRNNNRAMTNRVRRFFFSSYDKKEFEKIRKVVPEDLYFSALNTFLEVSTCFPEEYRNIINRADIINLRTYKRSPHLNNLPYLGYGSHPLEMHLGAKRLYYNYQAYEPLPIHIKRLEWFTDQMERGVTAENYPKLAKDYQFFTREFRKEINKSLRAQKPKAIAKKEDQPKKATEEKKDNKIVVPKKRTIFDALEEMPAKEKQELFDGIRLFSEYIEMSEEELLTKRREIELDGLEAKVLEVTFALHSIKNELSDGFYQLFKMDRDASEKQIVRRLVNIMNYDKEKMINKEGLRQGHELKGPMSAEERGLVEEYLRRVK